MAKKSTSIKKSVTPIVTEPPKRGTLRPFVSVICPTYNRRRFLPNLIHQFNYQTYSQDYMELIILDDSPETNADIIPSQKNIKYTYLPEKLMLGKKRNLINSMVTGDIIVCFDDDDYYSPERVSHAVNKLTISKMEIAGSSIIHIYYPRLKKILEFGPYAQYHGTNGTMAYTKKYLKTHAYLDDKSQAEEAHFTNNFSEPMVQLDPHKVILCIAHNKNTVEKDQFLNQGKPTTIKMQKFFKINDKYMIEYLRKLGEILELEYNQKLAISSKVEVPPLVEIQSTNIIEQQQKQIHLDLLQKITNMGVQIPPEIIGQLKTTDLINILNQVNEHILKTQIENAKKLEDEVPPLVEVQSVNKKLENDTNLINPPI